MSIQTEGLAQDVRAQWLSFVDSPIAQFLRGWTNRRIEEHGLKLEHIGPEDLRKVQGEIAELKKIRDLLLTHKIEDSLQSVIQYWEASK